MVLRWSQCCDSVLHFIQSCRKWNYSARIWRSGSGQFVQYTGSGCELVAPKMPAVNLNNLLEHFGLQNLVPKWTFVWIQENMSRECCFMIEWVWHVSNQLLASKRKSASDGIVCYVLWQCTQCIFLVLWKRILSCLSPVHEMILSWPQTYQRIVHCPETCLKWSSFGSIWRALSLV